MFYREHRERCQEQFDEMARKQGRETADAVRAIIENRFLAPAEASPAADPPRGDGEAAQGS